MSLPLQGKVALVSGGGKNIGRAIALTLARDGATVLVNGRGDKVAVDQVVAEIEAAGGQAYPAMGDISDTAVAPRLAAYAEKLGGVDILVSNAGLRRQTSFLDMSFEEWREILSVRSTAPFLLGKAFVPQMVAKGQGGAFVAISGHLDPCRYAQPLPCLGLEIRPRRADARARRRAGAAPHHLQRALARRDRHHAWRGGRRASRGEPADPAQALRHRGRGSPPWCACWSARRAPSSPPQTIHVNGGEFLT